MQVSSLIYAMGPVAEDILPSFGLSDNESKEYDDVMNKFEGYFVQRKILFSNERSSTREFKFILNQPRSKGMVKKEVKRKRQLQRDL